MKRDIVNRIMAAVGIAVMLIMGSCGGQSNADLLKEYEKKGNAAVDALMANNAEEGKKLFEETEKIADELNSRELSAEERQEFQEISMRILTRAMGLGKTFGMDNIYDMEVPQDTGVIDISPEAMEEMFDLEELEEALEEWER